MLQRFLHRSMIPVALLLTIGTIAIDTQDSLAQSWGNPVQTAWKSDSLGSSSKRLFITPHDNVKSGINATPSLNLAPTAVDNYMFEVFKRNSLHPQIEIRSQAQDSHLNLIESGSGAKHNIYEFYIGGVKLCDFQVKATYEDGIDPLVLGRMPAINDVSNITDNDSWPSIDDAMAQLNMLAGTQLGVFNLQLVSQEKCYEVDDNALHPAWKVTVKAIDLPYVGIADAYQAFELSPKFFDIDGSAKIYPNNITDSAMATYTLPGLLGNGHLQSSYFQTALWTGSKGTLATGSNNVFNFTPGTSEFAETSLFTNANRMLAWFISQGYSTTNFPQITIWVHAVVNGTVNNALYDTTGSGQIYVGDGDGVVLQNLATDSDVISHEFSHHIIYGSITNINTYEGLVTHEGLADFFAFIRSGNACLGQSICPAGSPICANANCLRTAENSFKWGDSNLPQEAHQCSQFLSGMLWDLKIKDGITADVLTKTVLKALEFFPSTVQFGDVIAGLLRADQVVSAGKNCGLIYNRAAERGLYSAISSFGCGSNTGLYSNAISSKYPGITNALPTASTVSSASQASGGSTVTSSASKSGGGLCGTIATPAASTTTGMIILWMLPMLLVFSRKWLARTKNSPENTAL